MGEPTSKCPGLGTSLTADTADAKVKRLQEHSEHVHNMDVPESAVREKANLAAAS